MDHKVKTPQEVYDYLWKKTVEDEEGNLKKDVVVESLYSYAAVLHNNRILFEYITNGVINDPSAPLSEVMQVSDEVVLGIVTSTVQDVIQDILKKSLEVDGDENRLKFIDTMFEKILTQETFV